MLREGRHNVSPHPGSSATDDTMDSEVESLIEYAVSEVIAETTSLESLRQDMIDKLVQALETDASWVELYGVTGELVVPRVAASDDELGAGLKRVLEVSRCLVMSRSLLTGLTVAQHEAFAAHLRRMEGDPNPSRCPADARKSCWPCHLLRQC